MRVDPPALQRLWRKNPPPAGKPRAVSASNLLVPPNLDACEPRLDAGGEVPSAEDDRALMAKIAAGDEAAFERLVDRHAEPIRRLTQRLLAYAPDAEDVVQDVFARAWERAGSFRADARVATWLTAIALNACRSRQRRAWVTRLAFLRWLVPPAPAAPAYVELHRRERCELVRAAIGALRQRDREVIVLHYLEERDAAEVAGLLGVSRGAVEVRLHRARKRLKELLTESGADGVLE